MLMLEGDDWLSIDTAPKDGRVVLVGHEDVGIFPMRWNAYGTNPLFAPGDVVIWEMVDGSMTWREGPEDGPSHWREALKTPTAEELNRARQKWPVAA